MKDKDDHGEARRWYVCKYCGRAYPEAEKLVAHKLGNHLGLMKEEKQQRLQANDETKRGVSSKQRKEKTAGGCSEKNKPAEAKPKFQARKKKEPAKEVDSKIQPVLKENRLNKLEKEENSLPISRSNTSDASSTPSFSNELFAMDSKRTPSIPTVRQEIVQFDLSEDDDEIIIEGMKSAGDVYLNAASYLLHDDLTLSTVNFPNAFGNFDLNGFSSLLEADEDDSPDLNSWLDFSVTNSSYSYFDVDIQVLPIMEEDFEPDQPQFGAWICQNCGDEFVQKAQRDHHHSSCYLYKCNKCHRSFSRRRYLLKHTSLAHSEYSLHLDLRTTTIESDAESEDFDDGATVSSGGSKQEGEIRGINSWTSDNLSLSERLRLSRIAERGRPKQPRLPRTHQRIVRSQPRFHCRKCKTVFGDRTSYKCHLVNHSNQYVAPMSPNILPSQDCFVPEDQDVSKNYIQYSSSSYASPVGLSNVTNITHDNAAIPLRVKMKYSSILYGKQVRIVLDRIDDNPIYAEALKRFAISRAHSNLGSRRLRSQDSVLANCIDDVVIIDTVKGPTNRNRFRKKFYPKKVPLVRRKTRPSARMANCRIRNILAERLKNQVGRRSRQFQKPPKLRSQLCRNTSTFPTAGSVYTVAAEESSDFALDAMDSLACQDTHRSRRSTSNSVISSADSLSSTHSTSSADSTFLDQIKSSPFPLVLVKRLNPSLVQRYLPSNECPAVCDPNKLSPQLIPSKLLPKSSVQLPDLIPRIDLPDFPTQPLLTCWLCACQVLELENLENHLRTNHNIYSVNSLQLIGYDSDDSLVSSIYSLLVSRYRIPYEKIYTFVRTGVFGCIECKRQLTFIELKLHIHERHHHLQSHPVNSAFSSHATCKSSSFVSELEPAPILVSCLEWS